MAALPDNIRAVYLNAYVAALHPVFLSAAAVALVGFALTWLLREVPLREAPGSEDIGESFAMPRQATSLEELEIIVARASRRENRWGAIRRIARSLDLHLEPDEIWLLVQLSRRGGAVQMDALEIGTRVPRDRLENIAHRLAARGWCSRIERTDLSLPNAGGTTSIVSWQGIAPG